MFLTESSFQSLSRDWRPGEDSRLLAAKHLICNAGQHPGAPCVPALCLGQPEAHLRAESLSAGYLSQCVGNTGPLPLPGAVK
jgi:hypothetical protein